MLYKAVQIVTWAGMRFRPSKCVTLTLPSKGLRYKIYSEVLPFIEEADAYPYLGIPIGDKFNQTPYITLDLMLADN